MPIQQLGGGGNLLPAALRRIAPGEETGGTRTEESRPRDLSESLESQSFSTLQTQRGYQTLLEMMGRRQTLLRALPEGARGPVQQMIQENLQAETLLPQGVSKLLRAERQLGAQLLALADGVSHGEATAGAALLPTTERQILQALRQLPQGEKAAAVEVLKQIGEALLAAAEEVALPTQATTMGESEFAAPEEGLRQQNTLENKGLPTGGKEATQAEFVASASVESTVEPGPGAGAQEKNSLLLRQLPPAVREAVALWLEQNGGLVTEESRQESVPGKQIALFATADGGSSETMARRMLELAKAADGDVQQALEKMLTATDRQLLRGFAGLSDHERQQAVQQLRQLAETFQQRAVGSAAESQFAATDTQRGERAVSFYMPLYFAGQEQPYPAHIHVFHRDEGETGGAGAQERETWLRVQLETEHAGMVTLICHMNREAQFFLRVEFPTEEGADSFQEYVPSIHKAFADNRLALGDLAIRRGGTG